MITNINYDYDLVGAVIMITNTIDYQCRFVIIILVVITIYLQLITHNTSSNNNTNNKH